MSELLLEKFGSKTTAAIFEQDEGQGFFFLYDSKVNKVIDQVRLYHSTTSPQVTLDDVDIFWSSDEKRAGFALWGRMRALLQPETNGVQVVCSVTSPDDPAIEEEFADFPQYLDRRKFLHARGRYWTDILLQSHPEAVISDTPLSLTESKFTASNFDSQRKHAVIFEEEGETGYLYLYSADLSKIKQHVHIYDKNSALSIAKDDLYVLWSTDESKCAVVIWGQVFGIIDLRSNKEGRVWLERNGTLGTDDPSWLKGFELM
jgi:hypothetical protein